VRYRQGQSAPEGRERYRDDVVGIRFGTRGWFEEKAMRCLRPLLICFLWFWCAGAIAGEPGEVVQNTTDQVLARVQSEKDQLRANPGQMYGLVSELIFPHFDFPIMSQWVLGEHWKSAAEGERARFIEQFRMLLVRTYAAALLEFSGQNISYPPIEQPSGKAVALVKQVIEKPGSATIPIIYRLHNKSGPWKVFDVSVDGVSLVKTYRASFGSMIGNKGLDGLLVSLEEKNKAFQ
jgi:phospholipid transport system substrate-binding protein